MRQGRLFPRALLVITVGLTGVVGCNAQSRGQSQTNEEAIRLVRRFVRADTMGDEPAALSLLAVHRCAVVPTSDAIRPTVRVEFGAATVRADTVRVPIRYFVLGVSHADGIGDSEQRVKFARALQVNADTFAVFRDSDGRLWIDCGPHAADHLGVVGMMELEIFMSESALREWRAALADAKARKWY